MRSTAFIEIGLDAVPAVCAADVVVGEDAIPIDTRAMPAAVALPAPSR